MLIMKICCTFHLSMSIRFSLPISYSVPLITVTTTKYVFNHVKRKKKHSINKNIYIIFTMFLKIERKCNKCYKFSTNSQ